MTGNRLVKPFVCGILCLCGLCGSILCLFLGIGQHTLCFEINPQRFLCLLVLGSAFFEQRKESLCVKVSITFSDRLHEVFYLLRGREYVHAFFDFVTFGLIQTLLGIFRLFQTAGMFSLKVALELEHTTLLFHFVVDFPNLLLYGGHLVNGQVASFQNLLQLVTKSREVFLGMP